MHRIVYRTLDIAMTMSITKKKSIEEPLLDEYRQRYGVPHLEFFSSDRVDQRTNCFVAVIDTGCVGVASGQRRESDTAHGLRSQQQLIEDGNKSLPECVYLHINKINCSLSGVYYASHSVFT